MTGVVEDHRVDGSTERHIGALDEIEKRPTIGECVLERIGEHGITLEFRDPHRWTGTVDQEYVQVGEGSLCMLELGVVQIPGVSGDVRDT